MLHASRYSEDGSCGDSSELAENSRILASLDRGLIKRVAKNCGKPTGFFKPLMTATDIYLLPKQALKLGLATNIGSAYLEVAINQTVAVRIK
jgi:ATP-dependent protease ClpP protease subunit